MKVYSVGLMGGLLPSYRQSFLLLRAEGLLDISSNPQLLSYGQDFT